MTAPQIPLYSGEVPSRVGQTKQQFSDNVNDWVQYYQASIPEVNTSVTFVNDKATETDILAQSTAQNSAVVISAANFKGEWSSLTGALTVPSTVYHNGSYWQLLIDIADVTLSEPTLVNTDWAPASQSAGRATVLSPFTLTIPGRYYILGSDTITIPTPVGQPDGISFDFIKQPDEQPTVSVGTDLVRTKLGLTDGIIMDMSQFEMVTNSDVYEV